MEFEVLKIKGKKVFICEEHHHVLRFWHQFKEQFPYLLSFDHHTDLRRAFQHYINTLYPLYKTHQDRTQEDWYSDQSKLLKEISENDFNAILKLKHDEHIDAAIQTGIIKKALTYTYHSYGNDLNRVYTISGNSDYDNEPIINNPILNHETKSYITSTELEEGFKRFDLCIPRSEWLGNYILDIDLDFFQTCKSIKPDDISFFKKIIDNAIAISIAKESNWIKQWKENHDENLSVNYLLDNLLELIKE